MRAVNALGRGEWSEELVIESVTSLYPNEPRELAVTHVQPWSFSLSWSMPVHALSENVLRYVLEVAAANETTFITLTQTDCTSGCGATIDVDSFALLLPNTSYTLGLRALNVYGSSVASSLVSVTTLPTVPDTVGQLSVSPPTQTSQTSVSVSWSEPASNGALVSSYRVWVCDVQSGNCRQEEVPGSPPATSALV